MMDLNNITILIVGLIIVSIVGLIYKNELIVTTVIGGLIGYLSKDVNVNVASDNVDITNPQKIEYNEDDEVA